MSDVTWTPTTIPLRALTPWERNPKRISKTHAAAQPSHATRRHAAPRQARRRLAAPSTFQSALGLASISEITSLGTGVAVAVAVGSTPVGVAVAVAVLVGVAVGIGVDVGNGVFAGVGVGPVYSHSIDRRGAFAPSRDDQFVKVKQLPAALGTQYGSSFSRIPSVMVPDANNSSITFSTSISAHSVSGGGTGVPTGTMYKPRTPLTSPSP